MKIEIKHRVSGAVLFSAETETCKLAVELAVKSRADLRGADLGDADLRSADLRSANIRDADLRSADIMNADLRGADLRDADIMNAYLRGANLRRADLRGANLRRADLRDAYLEGADLGDANLEGADLWGADLWGADLRGANLRGADLRRAYLRGANLRGAKNAAHAIAKTRILPDGALIGWKKAGGHLVKLLIPEAARRSHAFGRKCRAEFVDVLEIIGADVAVTSAHGPTTAYRVGERVFADSWDENFQNECSHGIHFFITREEAEEWK